MGNTVNMKSFAVLSALVACGLAAPAADADAQIIAGGVLGHGLLGYGHGLVNGVYASGPAVAAAAPVAVAAAAPVAVAHTAPVAVAHAAPVAIATAPVVHQVTVQKHVSTHSTHHVINHAPVVGAYAGLHGLPLAGRPVAGLPVAVAAAEVEAAEE